MIVGCTGFSDVDGEAMHEGRSLGVLLRRVGWLEDVGYDAEY